MKSNVLYIAVYVVVACAYVQLCSGHGHLYEPEVKVDTNPTMTESCSDIAPGMKEFYGLHPRWNADDFEADFKKTTYSGDLRALFAAKGVATDASRTNSQSQSLKEDEIIWGDPASQNGFTVDHHGPCALYITNGAGTRRVMYNKDCTVAFKGRPSRISVPGLRQLCGSECDLEFYWLTMGISNFFVPQGQVQYYVNRAKVSGAAGGEIAAPVPAAPAAIQGPAPAPVPVNQQMAGQTSEVTSQPDTAGQNIQGIVQSIFTLVQQLLNQLN